MSRASDLANVIASGSTNIVAEGTATTNLQQGLAKAWVDKAANGASMNDSFNIASLDDDGTGDFGLNYTNNFSTANYAVLGMADDGTTSTSAMGIDTTNGTNAAGSVDLEVYFSSGSSNRTNFDLRAYVAIHGDLA